MLAVDELSAYVAELIVKKEQEDEDQESTIYGVLLKTKAEHNMPGSADGDEIPEDAYRATAAFAHHLIDKLCKESALVVTKTLLSVNTLPDAPTAAQIEKLKQGAAMSGIAMMHMVQIMRTALTTIDWDYVAERVIEAGRKRAAGEKSSEGG